MARKANAATIVDPMTAMQAQIDALTALVADAIKAQSPKVEAPKVEPITWNIDGMTHAEVRQLAITHEVAVTPRGKVAQSTRDALKRKLGQVADAVTAEVQAHKANRSSAKVAIVSDGGLDLFSKAPMSAEERDGVRISSVDAVEALRTHPMRPTVLKVTAEGWKRVAGMGAFNAYNRVKQADGTTKVVGDESKGHKPNPAGLNGFDRRIARTLAFKPGTDAKVWTLYQGCLILDKLSAAGVLR